jgi:hypothetical protein
VTRLKRQCQSERLARWSKGRFDRDTSGRARREKRLLLGIQQKAERRERRSRVGGWSGRAGRSLRGEERQAPSPSHRSGKNKVQVRRRYPHPRPRRFPHLTEIDRYNPPPPEPTLGVITKHSHEQHTDTDTASRLAVLPVHHSGTRTHRSRVSAIHKLTDRAFVPPDPSGSVLISSTPLRHQHHTTAHRRHGERPREARERRPAPPGSQRQWDHRGPR